MNFLHSFIPKPIVFSIGSIDIHWYGIIIAVGLLVGLFITIKLAKKRQVDVNHVYNLFFYLVIFCPIGARIAHVIGDWCYYKNNLGEIYKIWDGGLGIVGAIFVGILIVYIYSRIKNIIFWKLTDLITPGIILSQSIGRWGNYFNQELFGRPTNLLWAIRIELSNRPVGYENYYFFHPLFLYESILDFIIFIILIFYINSKKSREGFTTLFYFLFYFLIRFFLEFLRINAVSLGFLAVVQWISLVFISICLIIYIKSGKTADEKS